MVVPAARLRCYSCTGAVFKATIYHRKRRKVTPRGRAETSLLQQKGVPADAKHPRGSKLVAGEVEKHFYNTSTQAPSVTHRTLWDPQRLRCSHLTRRLAAAAGRWRRERRRGGVFAIMNAF